MHLMHYAVMAGVAAFTECRTGSFVTDPGGGSTGSQTAPGPVVDVAIRDFAFTPATVTVKAGTTVRWTNRGASPHTATSDDGVWDSYTLRAPNGGGGYGEGGGRTGWSFEFTFAHAGTYGYHCAIHPPSQYPSFTGAVTVVP